jgi:hypothetical protein
MREAIDWYFILVVTGMGALIGIGQLLDSDERLTWKIIMGRAMVSGGLAACSPLILVWLPHLPQTVEFAFAALLASLGASGLQLIVAKFLYGKAK